MRVFTKCRMDVRDGQHGMASQSSANKDTDMKIYVITDEQQDNIEQKHDSLAKTQGVCELMLDIAAQASDVQTFEAALELANGELDRLELFFDSYQLV